MKLMNDPIIVLVYLTINVFQGHFITAFLSRFPGKGTKTTTVDANIGTVNMKIPNKISFISMKSFPHQIGQISQQV
jgi:hypothetical protein